MKVQRLLGILTALSSSPWTRCCPWSCLAACPPGDNCGPYGVCITDSSGCTGSSSSSTSNASQFCNRICSCYPGYYGDDCSFVAQICPSSVGPNGEQICFNGGTCVAQEVMSGDTYVTTYVCDCRTASGDAEVYAGAQCEFPGETSCEAGKRMSTYAFCVNGGRCQAVVQSGQAFPGCDCVGLFQGRHCQYAYGTAPAQELIYMPAPRKGGLSPGIIGLTVLLALGFLAGMFFWMYRKSRRASPPVLGLDMSPAPPTFADIRTSYSPGDNKEGTESDLALEEVAIDGDERRMV